MFISLKNATENLGLSRQHCRVKLVMLVLPRKVLLNLTSISGECLSLIKANYSSNTHQGNDVITG